MKGFNKSTSCINCEHPCIKDCELNDEEIQLLEKNSRGITYRKGETIFKQFAFVSHIIYIKNGLAKLYIEGSSGKNIIVKFLKSGDFIGLPALFTENFYYYTAVSLKPSNVCMIEKNAFNQLVKENNCLAEKILKWYSEDHQFLFSKMAVIGTKQLHGRLAESILYLTSSNFDNSGIFNFITRKDIAELSGMSTESMIRLMNEFKNDKIINVNGKEITINDRSLLERLSQAG